MARLGGGWAGLANTSGFGFKCGHCGVSVASEKGWICKHPNGQQLARIQVCPQCHRPTFFEDSAQWPGVSPGSPVAHLPRDTERLYEEARTCVANNAYTSAVLALRKLLMHIAVDQGAPTGK